MENKEVIIEELNNLKESIKELQTTRNTGITPVTYLGISLIVLKVANLVTWSWWLVLIPFYVPYIISLVLTILFTKKLYFYAKEITAFRKEIIKEGTGKTVEESAPEVVTIPIIFKFTEKEIENSNPGEFNTATVNTETTKKPKKKNKKKGEDNGEETKITTEESRSTKGTSASNN